MPIFDPDDDFASVADGLQRVTLSRPGTSLAIELAALRRAVGRREAACSGGRYTTSDIAWHLPGASQAVSPQVGDLLVDGDGERWTILGVFRTTLGSRWKCVCRSLAIARGLDGHIDLEKAVVTRSAAGAELLAWQTWRTGLAARIEPVAIQLDGKAGGERRLYRIYLLDAIEIDGVCRARAPDGTRYRILGSRRGERLGELMYLEAERQ